MYTLDLNHQIFSGKNPKNPRFGTSDHFLTSVPESPVVSALSSLLLLQLFFG